MYSVLDLLLAFFLGLSVGAALIWLVVGQRKSAITAIVGAIPAVICAIYRW
jgi:hypothetical protein